MRIIDIYNKYPIPSSLQQHQLRAAAVGSIIAGWWDTSKVLIDTNAIIQTLLLHDMGNIIKFDILKFLTPEEETNIKHWENLKQKYRQKYNDDEHRATYHIAKELGVSKKLYYLLTHIGSSNLYKTVASNDWEVKIVSYADLRCAPYGVVSVNERFDDLIKRYKGRTHALSNIENTQLKRNYCLQVEQQIQQYVKSDLATITEKMIIGTIDEFRNYNI